MINSVAIVDFASTGVRDHVEYDYSLLTLLVLFGKSGTILAFFPPILVKTREKVVQCAMNSMESFYEIKRGFYQR